MFLRLIKKEFYSKYFFLLFNNQEKFLNEKKDFDEIMIYPKL